jgi:hypothetical protein
MAIKPDGTIENRKSEGPPVPFALFLTKSIITGL